MKHFTHLAIVAVLGASSSDAAFAATGSISASPKNVIVVSGQLGSTSINWSSSGMTTAEVWVSVDDGPEAMMSRSTSASVTVPWIQAGRAHRFTLYSDTQHTIPLANVVVLGIPAGGGAIAATPTSVNASAGGVASTVIEWGTNGHSTAEVWVSMDGAPETLFARAAAATQPAPWIQPGHDYQFRLFAGTSHSQLLDTVRVWGDPAYKVGVNYHSTGSDFSSTAFLTRYHLPGVRDTVKAQLQGMANRGASLIHTRIWMVTSPGGPDFGEPWRAHFPLSSREATNLRTFTQDLANIRAKEGHRLRLDITLLWLGDADYQRGTPSSGLGWANLTAAEFGSRVQQTVASVLASVADVTRPDGRRVVETIFLDGEVMIGAKANQEWFLRSHYPTFVQSVRNAGLNPSLYFLAAATEVEVLDNNFVDPTYPILNGHRSMYWLYRSLKFLRMEGLALPQRIDFSCYPTRSVSNYSTLVRRIFDDADATLPSLGLVKKYGVAETYYFPSNAEREAMGDAFAVERNVSGRLDRIQFWTTPDSGGPGIHAGYPFEIEDYLP